MIHADNKTIKHRAREAWIMCLKFIVLFQPRKWRLETISHIFDTDYFLGNTNDNLKFSPSLLIANNFLPCKFLSLIKKHTRYDKKGVKQKYSNKSYLWCIVTHAAALQGGTSRMIVRAVLFTQKLLFCFLLWHCVSRIPKEYECKSRAVKSHKEIVQNGIDDYFLVWIRGVQIHVREKCISTRFAL